MNFVQRLEQWGDTHHPKWVDILRIFLGLFLCFKGIEFLTNMGMVLNLMSNKLSYNSFTLVMLGQFIAFAHLLGGFLLAIGLLTRFACIIQIPILMGAVIFINFSRDMLRPFSELTLSILVLILLIYFLIVGSGPWSFDRYIDRENKEKEKRVH